LPQLGRGLIRKCARVNLGSGDKKPKLWSRTQCGAIMHCAAHPCAADNGASTATVAERSPPKPGKRAGAFRRGGCVHEQLCLTGAYAARRSDGRAGLAKPLSSASGSPPKPVFAAHWGMRLPANCARSRVLCFSERCANALNPRWQLSSVDRSDLRSCEGRWRRK
jgi:hypothetical protein